MEITAKSPKTGKSLTVEYAMGETLAELVQTFGEDVVYNVARQQLVIKLQAVIRSGLDKGASDEEIRNHVKAWRPGVAARFGVDALKVAESKFDSLTPEEQDAYIAQLQERRRKAKKAS